MAQEEPIRLFLRLRPPQHPSKPVHWTSAGSTISGELGTFSADSVYDERSNNNAIFNSSVVPIVEKCCQGYNTALMAYGQSGSGKTHTVLGDTKDEGLLPQIITHLFEEVERQQKISDRSFLVLLQMMELYCEKFIDLLGNDAGQRVAVMEEKGITRVVNLKEIPIKTKQQAFDLIKMAQERRVVGATELNDQSSRSHVIVQLTVESSMTVAGKSNLKSRRSVMNIVDLAGSENAANNSGLRAKEGANINLSLLTLTRVINILTDKNAPSYIPYRDSNLTRVLKPCLGGNSSTLIICCLDPQNKEETLRTLKFSERLKLVKGQVQVNEEVEGGQLNEYLNEIASLKKALSEQQEAKDEQEAKTKRLLELKNFIIGANEGNKQPVRVIRRQTICANASNTLRMSTFSPPPCKKGKSELKIVDEEISSLGGEFKISGPESESTEQRELDELRRDNLDQEMEIRGLKDKMNLLREEFKRKAEDERKRVNEELEKKDKIINELQSILTAKDDCNFRQQELIEELKISESELKKQAEDERRKKGEEMSLNKKAIEELKEETATKNEKITELQAILLNKEEDSKKQQELLKELQQSLQSLKVENEIIPQLKSELEQQSELNRKHCEEKETLRSLQESLLQQVAEVKELIVQKEEAIAKKSLEIEYLRQLSAEKREESIREYGDNEELIIKEKKIEELNAKLAEIQFLSKAKDQDILNQQTLIENLKESKSNLKEKFDELKTKAEEDRTRNEEAMTSKEEKIDELQTILKMKEEEISDKQKLIEDLQNALQSSKTENETIRQRVVTEIQETVSAKMASDGELISQLKSELNRLTEANAKMCEEEEQLHSKCKTLELAATEAKELLEQNNEVVASQSLELEHLRQLANENITLHQSLRQKDKEILDKIEAAEHFKRKAQDSVRELRESGSKVKELEELNYQSNKKIEELYNGKKLAEDVHNREKIGLQKQISEKEEVLKKVQEISRQEKLELIKLKSDLDKKTEELGSYQKRIEEMAAEKASMADNKTSLTENIIKVLKEQINELQSANEAEKEKSRVLEEELLRQKMITERALKEKVLPSFSSDTVSINEMSRLKKENERLQRQIRDLEDEVDHKAIENKENKNSDKELETLKEQVESLLNSQKQRISKTTELENELEMKVNLIKESEQKLIDFKNRFDKGVEAYNELRNDYDGLKSEARVVYDKYRKLKETHASCLSNK